jgi:hypothetical protein
VLSVQNYERILKQRSDITYKGKHIRIEENFSTEIITARRERNDVSQA